MEHSSPRRRSFWLVVLLVVLVIPAVACSAPSFRPAAEGPAVILKNESGTKICYVYISPTSDALWGEDRLGDLELIRNGRSRTFEVTAGQWDMMAQDCDQNEVDVRLEQDVDGLYDWTIE
jgi:hypothetical protein